LLLLLLLLTAATSSLRLLQHLLHHWVCQQAGYIRQCCMLLTWQPPRERY
jgi:hypothetical protein